MVHKNAKLQNNLADWTAFHSAIERAYEAMPEDAGALITRRMETLRTLSGQRRTMAMEAIAEDARGKS